MGIKNRCFKNRLMKYSGFWNKGTYNLSRWSKLQPWNKIKNLLLTNLPTNIRFQIKSNYYTQLVLNFSISYKHSKTSSEILGKLFSPLIINNLSINLIASKKHMRQNRWNKPTSMPIFLFLKISKIKFWNAINWNPFTQGRT